MDKFKVGDLVKVKENLECNRRYDNGCCFSSGMKEYLGKKCKIKKIFCNDRYILEGCDPYRFSPSMLEKIVEKEHFKSLPRDFTGTLEIKDGFITKKEEIKEILDKEEKEYLSSFIKPFRNKVSRIVKIGGIREYIFIGIINDCDILLPSFEKGKMYKNMETDERYTLEELGL